MKALRSIKHNFTSIQIGFILLTICVFISPDAGSQNLILNPGFEDNTLANGCYTNQSAANVTAYLNNITAFYGGTQDGIDIGINQSCYAGGANSGAAHIVMAGLSAPNMYESISFDLSSSIISGATYTISFYASNSNPVGNESLSVGVSSAANVFGTQATLVPLGLNTTYTQYSATFVAPASGAYLTVQPAVLGDFWFGLDDFDLQIMCTPASGVDTITACNTYTWIDGNTYSASNNSATYTIVGGAANGCDSVVTLNLTINSVTDLSTATSGITISSNNMNATYQWLDCNNNYAIITGETSASYTPSANGNYAVELTENGCVDTSACVAINSVGLTENIFGRDIVLFPNPTNGQFFIDLAETHNNVIVKLRDLNGRLIQSAKYTEVQLLKLNLEGAAGIYFISIESADKEAIFRIVKE